MRLPCNERNITIMTKCIATVGDVFVGTDRNIFIEDIDKCDTYS